MGRAKLLIDKVELQKAIDELESNTTFNNRNELYTALAQTDWAKGIKNSCGVVNGVNPASINQRVNEFKLTLKTPVGKRGRVKGAKVTGTKVSRSVKIQNNSSILASIKAIRESSPKTSVVTNCVDGLEKGSMRSAIRLKCMECNAFTGGHTKCEINDCALYPINMLIWPRKETKIVEEIAEEEDDLDLFVQESISSQFSEDIEI